MIFKACGIRAPLKEYKMDFLGFNFISYSKRKIDLKTAQTIINDINTKKAKVKKIWLFDINNIEKISVLLKNLNLDWVQLYNANLNQIKQLKQLYPKILIIYPVKYFELKKISKELFNFINFLLIDSAKPGSGKSYDYSLVLKNEPKFPYLLAGGINLENIQTIKKIFKNSKFFKWVDIASGVDNGSNIDEDKVNEIFKILKQL